MNPRDHIAEKIKKLLRLSKSPNSAEAAAALAKAMEIATAKLSGRALEGAPVKRLQLSVGAS